MKILYYSVKEFNLPSLDINVINNAYDTMKIKFGHSKSKYCMQIGRGSTQDEVIKNGNIIKLSFFHLNL